MVQEVLGVLGVVIAVAILTATLRREWLDYYIIALAVLIALPFSAAYLLYKIAMGIGRLAFELLEMLSKATSKVIVFVCVVVPSTLAILSTTTLPRLGKPVLKLDKLLLDSANLGLADNLEFARTTMVKIVVDKNEKEPRYASIEPYRDEFEKVKKEGKEALSAGDTILSISLGGLLLISQVFHLGIFQIDIYGWVAAVLVQVGLFVLSLSILYRTFILDFLTFDGDEDFISVEEADVALDYQRAVSQVAFVQLMMVAMIFASRLSNVEREIVESTLRDHYRDETTFIDTMKFAWQELQKQN